MKWWRILLIIAIVVTAGLAALNMTKPDKRAHYDLIKGTILEVVSKELNENPVLQPYAATGTMKALEATDELLGRALIIHDHTYYNIGLIIYNDNLIPVTVGVLGKVHLTMNESDLQGFLKRPEFMESFGVKDLKKVEEFIRTLDLP